MLPGMLPVTFWANSHQMLLNGTTWLRSYGPWLVDELELSKRIINTIAIDQVSTSVANLTERAEKKTTLGTNRQKDPPETVTRIETKTKAGSWPIYTKKDIIKGHCTKRKANHQSQIKETVTANVIIEKDIRSIIAHSIRKIPITTDVIRQELAKDSVIGKAMNYVQRKWPAPPVQGELLHLYNR